MPKEVQKSSKPMTGSFTISCPLEDGSMNTTTDILSSTNYWNIPNYIAKACPNLRDRFDLWEGPAYSYVVDGRDLLIRFTDVKKDLPQLTIQTYDSNPIIANEVTFSSETVTPFGNTLMYEPIPFEWLYTAETKPQVLVTVDNLPAVCAAIDCGYTYTEATSQVTSFSLSGLTLTINGNNLPLTSDIVNIKYSNVLCTPTSVGTSQITCTLASLVAGTWQPQITDINGLIPVDVSASAQTTNIVASSISPSSVYPKSQSLLTIIGQNLPTSISDGSSILITFPDSSECRILKSTSTQIICQTPEFSTSLAGSTLTLTLNINGQTDSTLSIQVASSTASITSITPSNVSPVLKSLITLQVDNGFAGVLSISDLSVKIIDQNTTRANDKAINVVAVDNTLKTITIKYGGAYSGLYNLYVNSVTYGTFDTSAVVLTAIGQVADFTPKEGSVYGGTLVTIAGHTFGTEATDNPVKVGDSYCLVETTTPTEITCRTLPRNAASTDQIETLLVFLKTSEEAKCNVANNCDYKWLLDADLPVLTSYTVTFVNNNHQVTLTGTGFPTLTSDVIFQIDGIPQSIASASATEIVVTITNMLSSSSKNINFYLPSGTPSGAAQLIAGGINLTPNILSVSPSVGSPAGSIITAVVKGVGTSSTSVTLLTSANVDLCASVTIPSYGVVRCQTKAATVASTIVKVQVGTSRQSCTTGNCAFSTSATLSSMTSAVISLDKLSMTITGTNFMTSGNDGKVSYAGIDASTVTIDSSTQITASWVTGVPITQTAVSPVVAFQSQSSAEKHWAQGTAAVANVPTVTALSSDVTCSFNGGCTLQIDSTGLASQLAISGNELRVCENKCTLLASESSSSSVKCAVPALSTSYSITNYKIQSTSGYIMGSVFSSNQTGQYALTNNVNQDYYLDTSPTCSFGSYFKSGYIGQLSEVKFFMPVFVKANFVDKLKFQGSQDGTTYTDIFTVGSEIHEGWNYYDFQDSNLKYRYYRFLGSAVGACKIGEMKFRGVETIDSSASTYPCSATLNLAGQTPISLTGTVTYSSSVTPIVTNISPRYGKVQGGELVTFTGTGFSNAPSDVSIKIDGISCVVQSATSASITCLTGSRPGLYPNPSTEITIAGKGSAAMQGKLFRYVNYWSLTDTWGGEFAPIEGESVSIPSGLHLLVDVDSTPILQAVIVQGSLIFPPNENDENHLRTFDAHYVMVNGGYLEVGTEEYPYTSKIIITMHSTRQSPEIPTYGNKVIAVRNGILDFHGVPRDVTWTELQTTALPGASTITLIEAVDWKAGEEIVIAPTGYDNREAELRTIVSVDRSTPSKPVITLNKALTYKHYAGIQTFGSDTFEMRAEVGLITRNVVYRGDPETSSANEYGAHIMLHSAGDESLIGRIEYCEFRDVGQAFQLGRYPIHFHLIGTVHNSYVRGNAIHHTYNRAVTIHGVHYLRVINNVAYHTMGHTFFIEDAVETKNFIDHNLAVQTMASFSLLITDQTPASFWITHPDNIFRNNHAAGSDRYGYWFDTKPHPMGPSFSPDICPENDQLGEFVDNVAHSNGRYGLRIFHNLIPRQRPCDPIVYNASNTADPYASNPLVTAEFRNFRGWKNNRNGAIAEKVGDVRFINFKVADNLVAGIEFSLTGETMDGTAQIIDALVVGHSANAEQVTMDSSFHGIITPRTENFQVNGAKFYNYDQPGHAALGSCSHCFHPASTDSGARTITFSRIYFDSSVTTKIRYQLPWRDIFFDTDGSLTGLGPNTWATPFWPHNVQPECQVDIDVYDGILCDSTVQVRRLAFWNWSPNIFGGNELKVTQWDDSLVGSNKTAYIQSLNNETDVSIVPFKADLDPSKGWAVPFVTGHKYKVHWRYGIDFIDMQIDQSSRWKAADKNLYLVFNFTDVREKVEFRLSTGDIIENMTLTNKTNTQWQTADNIVYNDTETREIHTVFNGRNSTKNSLKMKGYRCVGSCLTSIEEVVVETTVRRWSDPNSWPNKTVPANMSNVEVESGWNMLYDMAETNPPTVYNMIQVNGRLTFEDEVKDLTLRAKYLFVRAGELLIGNATNPFQRKANIVLHGEKENQQIVYDNAIEAGNKILANTASVSVYGAPRNRISRLTATSQPGDTKIFVETGLDWRVGDELGLTTSTLRYNDTDYAKVVSYNTATGEVVLDRALTAYHYGAAVSTAGTYNGIDIRNEVYMLTRNVKIQGQDVEAWGCQIVTSDFVEANGVIRKGRTYLNNVQIYNCSQFDTFKAALRFEGNTQGWSEVAYSSIYHGWGYGVMIASAANVKLTENTIFSFVKRGINVYSSANITLDGNHVADVAERSFLKVDNFFEPTGGIIVCADNGDTCTDIKLVNNVVSACVFTGFAMFTHNCGNYDTVVFRDNVAHSIRDTGGIMFADATKPEQKQCAEASRFAAYKCGLDGLVAFHSAGYKKLVYTDMTFIDNGYGATGMVGMEGDDLAVEMTNIVNFGESEARDCFYENECKKWDRQHAGCVDRSGLMIAYFAQAGKDPLPKSTSAIPVHKIKKDASYGGQITYRNMRFVNFKQNSTWCGTSQRMIRLNEYAADYIPRAKFINTTFENSIQDTFAFLYSPPAAWANLDDCGDFPCTAPNNVLLQFEKSRYTGTLRPNTDSDFQILPNNVATVKGYTGCKKIDSWNGYYCTNDNLGVLLFESIDDDKWKRMISPIYIKNNSTSSINTLNTFMDHIWDGFYTGQLRLARWPSIIQTGTNMTYDIVYKGTPPEKQRFSLRADYSAVLLRIDYPKAGSYAVTDFNGNVIAANKWDDSIQALATIKRSRCGENRFIGVENILEFYITAGCSLMIKPLDSIRTAVRLQWTMSEFYSDGGTTTFVDRLAASLGIHASTIKVVAVYQGSVIVQFVVTPTGSGSDTVANVKEKIQKTLLSGATMLGAPIIGLMVNDVPLIVDGTTINNGGNTDNGNTNNNNTNGTNGGTIVYNNTTPIVIVAQEGTAKNEDQVKLIIIFAVIVVVIIIGAIASYFIYRRYKSKQLLDNVNKQLKQLPGDSIRDSNVSNNQVGDNIDNEVYEPQYHPKAELGNIFGSKTAKINNADDVARQDTYTYDDNGLPIPLENDHTYTDQSNLDDIKPYESTPLHSNQDVVRSNDPTLQQRRRTSVRIEQTDSGPQEQIYENV